MPQLTAQRQLRPCICRAARRRISTFTHEYLADRRADRKLAQPMAGSFFQRFHVHRTWGRVRVERILVSHMCMKLIQPDPSAVIQLRGYLKVREKQNLWFSATGPRSQCGEAEFAEPQSVTPSCLRRVFPRHCRPRHCSPAASKCGIHLCPNQGCLLMANSKVHC